MYRLGRLMPRRSGIDPGDIPWALSRLFLVDYERDTQAFRYRVAGREIEEVFGRSAGSISIRRIALHEALPESSARVIQERWRPLAEHGDIVYMRGLVYLAVGRARPGARILLPLSDRDDGLVTGLIGFTTCEWCSPGNPAAPPGLDIYNIPASEVAVPSD